MGYYDRPREREAFEGQGKAVYSVAAMRMGVRFKATAPRKLLTLRKWLAELSGEAAGEEEVTENEVRADLGGDVSGVLSDQIGEFMRKGVLAGGYEQRN